MNRQSSLYFTSAGSRCRAVIAVGIGIACVGPRTVGSQDSPRTIAGTYSVFVCKGSCTLSDSMSAIAVGRLVLIDSAVDVSSRPDSSHHYLRLSSSFISRAPNGCFLFSRRASNPQSYVGVRRVGLLKWQWNVPRPTAGEPVRSIPATSDSVIHFPLYRSPDAGHEVTVHVQADTLRGRGHSWGAGVTEVDWPDDSVIARRLGPPDLEPCFAAAGEEWRRVRHERNRHPWWLPQN